MIRLGKYGFNPKYWSGISNEATALIMHLLDVDPSTRLSSTQALQSDWIRRESLLNNNLANSLTGILNESFRLKGVVRSVQWVIRSGDKKAVSSLTFDGVDSNAQPQYSNLEIDLHNI
jgi:serine/threonine protein kinase